MVDRSCFVKAAGLASMGVPFVSFAAAGKKETVRPICVFSKDLRIHPGNYILFEKFSG